MLYLILLGATNTYSLLARIILGGWRTQLTGSRSTNQITLHCSKLRKEKCFFLILESPASLDKYSIINKSIHFEVWIFTSFRYSVFLFRRLRWENLEVEHCIITVCV